MPAPFEVTAAQVVALKAAFTPFMNQLLEAERAAQGTRGHQLSLNWNETIGDGGVDADYDGAIGSEWVPAGHSVWQFKSGEIQPKQAADELDRDRGPRMPAIWRFLHSPDRRAGPPREPRQAPQGGPRRQGPCSGRHPGGRGAPHPRLRREQDRPVGDDVPGGDRQPRSAVARFRGDRLRGVDVQPAPSARLLLRRHTHGQDQRPPRPPH